MGRINYSTRTSISGPILIDRDHLEQLDVIFLDAERQFEAANTKACREAAEKEFRQDKPRAMLTEENLAPYLKRFSEELPFCDSTRKLVVSFGDKKTFIGKSFGELFREPAIDEETAKRFDYFLKVGSMECKVRGVKNGASLYLETSPDHLDVPRETFAALRKWASKIEPPRWQQLLRSIYGIFIFLFIIIALGLFDSNEANLKEVRTAELKEEAKRLLQDGLQTSEQAQALEIMLSLQADYFGSGAVEKMAPAAIKTLIIQCLSAIACLFLGIWPSMELAVGRGEQKIKLWRGWLKIGFYTIPGWVIAVFLLPKLETMVRSAF